MNMEGLSQLKLRKSKCRDLEVLVGGTKLFDTDPKALRELLHLKERMRVDAFVCELDGEGSFHPKVLVVENPGTAAAVLGSSNCTAGGYQRNIEANILLEQPAIVRQLQVWFESLIHGAHPSLVAKRLTMSFITEYEKGWRKAQAKRRAIARIAQGQRGKIAKAAVHESRAWEDLVREARRWRRAVRRDAAATARAVAQMKAALDYPTFRRLDREGWRRFFEVPDLGKLNALYRDRVVANPRRLRVALRALVNEERQIADRLDAFLRQEGVGPNIATKILTIHDQRRYPTWNGPVEETLREFGVESPRGLSFGRKYVEFQHQMQNLVREARYRNMLEVDVFLYQYWWAEE